MKVVRPFIALVELQFLTFSDIFEFNDHIKGIKSKIEAFGGFKSPTTAFKEEVIQSSSDLITTKKPLTTTTPQTTTTKPTKPVAISENIEAIETSAEKIRETESITVNTPPPEASIAEAKPVALSIAGVGGVASAKPVATAGNLRFCFELLLNFFFLLSRRTWWFSGFSSR